MCTTTHKRYSCKSSECKINNKNMLTNVSTPYLPYVKLALPIHWNTNERSNHAQEQANDYLNTSGDNARAPVYKYNARRGVFNKRLT